MTKARIGSLEQEERKIMKKLKEHNSWKLFNIDAK